MRTAHWLRGMSALRCPSSIVVLDTETHCDEKSTKDTAIHVLTLGHAIFYRIEGGKRTRQKECTFYTIDAFWDWLETVVEKKRSTYIFGHNLGYDLGILDAWYRFRDDKWSFYRVAVERNIVYIDGTLNDNHVVFVDTTNYWKVPLQTIAKAMGVSKTELPDTSVPSDALLERCKVDVDITAMAVDKLIDWVSVNAYGPFGVSAASLAMNTYKKKFMKHQILVHDNSPALELERSSYFGGLVDTPFIGELKDGPYYETDIVSMYPSVCMSDLPTILNGVVYFPNLDKLWSIARDKLCIASVSLNTDVAYYPVRHCTGTRFPTGRFSTVLADSEFRYAYEHKHIVQCDMICLYDKAPIFKDYMEHFLAQKKIARATGNDMHESLSKLMLNGLYGKTAQLSPCWFPINSETVNYAEQYYKLPSGTLRYMLTNTPNVERFEKELCIPKYSVQIPMRQLWQDVEIQIGERETRDSVPQIATMVTSAARIKLRLLQHIAGKGNYVYSDTDSLWVNERGLTNLTVSGMIGHDCGQLEVKGICDSITIYGRKDYEAHGYRKYNKQCSLDNRTDIIKRKGIRPKAIPLSNQTFQQEKWQRPISQIRDGNRGYVCVETIIKSLHRGLTHCVLQSDGSTRPLIYPGEE